MQLAQASYRMKAHSRFTPGRVPQDGGKVIVNQVFFKLT
jgi:hypothetical protein